MRLIFTALASTTVVFIEYMLNEGTTFTHMSSLINKCSMCVAQYKYIVCYIREASQSKIDRYHKFLRDFDAGYSCWSGIPDKPINLFTPDKPLPVNLIK